ncbi:MAG: ATP-binding cassette domain-containing protein [Oscillospiraceae bacterium]|nr:ATP-binding cassette domain-containing protein [Oscillospiraceae bacterium]
MEQLKLKSLSFAYPQAKTFALDQIDLTVEQGEFLTVCGESGCGKTTLLRLLKPELAPGGVRQGEVLLTGHPIEQLSSRESAAKIGFVLQNPTHQIVTDTVWHELAFGLENLGVPCEEIRMRVAETASFFGIEPWFRQNISTLSGGQKQLVCLASVMALRPEILILDEPTAGLDPIAAQEFLSAVGTLNREFGTTVILSEHRLEEAIPLSNRVLVLDAGRIAALGSPHEVGEILTQKDHPMRLALPTPQRIYHAVDRGDTAPLTPRDGKVWLNEFAKTHPPDASRIPQDTVPQGEQVITAKDVWFRYEKEGEDVLRGMNLNVHRGELFALVGGNGAGKSTALTILAGQESPQRGKVCMGGNVCVLPQDVQTLFVGNTVKEFLGEDCVEVAELCRIGHLLELHPYDLSGGEQQRAALAKLLLCAPDLLLLDEPTRGMDAFFKREFAEILNDLRARGVTVLLVTHDLEFAAEYASRCALLFDGEVLSCSTPRAFFSQNRFYTTAANRMAGELLARAVTAEDVILACGGVVPSPPKPPQTPQQRSAPNVQKESHRPSSFLAMMTPILAALTVFLGLRFFGPKRYLLTGLLILLEVTVPFFLAFERRKPPASEIVTVSVLCALAVAGRGAFFALPQVKPALAVVIVAGLSLGMESGCLVGAMTVLVSNFFFGQGPWTPWQMLALGLIGLLSGLLPKNIGRGALCVFGFLSALVIYGGILNPASVLIAHEAPTLKLILAAFASGLSFDLIHAVSTAGFLWFFSNPMREKLRRMRQKTVDFSMVK